MEGQSALLLTQNSKYPSKISIENFVPSEVKGYRTNAFKDVNNRLSLVPEGAISIKKVLKMAENATLRLVAYGQVSIISAITSLITSQADLKIKAQESETEASDSQPTPSICTGKIESKLDRLTDVLLDELLKQRTYIQGQKISIESLHKKIDSLEQKLLVHTFPPSSNLMFRTPMASEARIPKAVARENGSPSSI
jgi:hypothetical protein